MARFGTGSIAAFCADFLTLAMNVSRKTCSFTYSPRISRSVSRRAPLL
jgi:hypothetical protein